jgi:hypothetical protein
MTEIIQFADASKVEKDFHGEEEYKVSTPGTSKKSRSLKVFKFSTLESITIRDKVIECNTNIGESLA